MKAFCEARVSVPEELRVGGRGFQRHYIQKRCCHYATPTGLCTVHQRQQDRGRYIFRVPTWSAERRGN